MEDISNEIIKIGNELVNCPVKECEGVTNDKNSGRIPRCLFYDNQDRKEEKGCVIVGINPGIMKKNNEEQLHYLSNKDSLNYDTIYLPWNKVRQNGKEHKYYKFLRDFVNNLGFKGPILWTELVKCEKQARKTQIPLQTFRICTSKYLKRELDLISDDWLIVAVGREAHKALSYLYAKRSILGIPHPTSSRGYFNKLYLKKKFGSEFRKQIKTKLEEYLKTKGSELWLS